MTTSPTLSLMLEKHTLLFLPPPSHDLCAIPFNTMFVCASVGGGDNLVFFFFYFQINGGLGVS
jgi:hypothetical protein